MSYHGWRPNQYTRCHRCYFYKYNHCHWQSNHPNPMKPDGYCPDYGNREQYTKEWGCELEVDADWLKEYNERKEEKE